MQKTMQTLITDVERLVYNSAGPAVQVYSQDVILQKLNQAFDQCFKAKFWPQFLVREVRTLDGATGKTTAPFSSIKEWEDVHSVFRAGSPTPIPTMPESYNLLDIPSSAVPKFLEPSNDTTLFTAYPLQSAGQIVVVGRARPATFDTGSFALTDTVPFDYMALEFHAAWEMAVDEASNGAMAAKFEMKFNSRMRQLEENNFDNFVYLNPRSEQIPTEWH